MVRRPSLLRGADIKRRVRRGAARGLNAIGADLMALSVEEAPVEFGDLRASALGPANDPASRATEDDLEAMVSFNRPYAAAQHEGRIVYEEPVTYTVREHQRRTASGVTTVREHAATIGPGEVVFRNHPLGGKDHYLEDPLKSMIPSYERRLAVEVGRELEG